MHPEQPSAADLEREVRDLRARLAAAEARADARPIALGRVLDAFPHFAALCSPDGQVVEVNRVALEARGIDPSLLLGQRVDAVALGPGAASAMGRVRAAFDRAREGHSSYERVRVALGTGHIIADVSVEPLAAEDGRVDAVFVTAIDVTDRLRTADRLRRKEHHLLIALAAGAMGTWHWNVDEDHLVMDEFQCALWDYPAGTQMRPNRTFERIHPDDLDRVRIAVERTLEGSEPFVETFRIVLPDGRTRWIGGRGDLVQDGPDAPRYLVGVNFDVTKERTRERALVELQRMQELALDAGGMGVWQFDLASGTMLCDVRTRELFGLDVDEQATLPLSALKSNVHPDDVEHLRGARLEAMALDGPGAYDVEFRVLIDDEVRWLHTAARCWFRTDVDGKRLAPESFFGVTQDITEDRRFEQQLDEARRMAEGANQAKTEFLANMSHEIRTPMTAILGFTDRLAKGVVDPDNLQLVETIRRNGRHLLAILNDILDLAKIEAGEFSVDRDPVEVHAFIEDVRALMEVRAGDTGLELRVEHGENVPRFIEGDGTRLRQVLLNLVGNAIKFTPEGRVTIETSFDVEGGTLVLTVSDTGVGIAPEDLERLFHPFTQADTSVRRTHGGTGLGLTICRRLCRAMGGDLVASSVPGTGSRFTVSVPGGAAARAGFSTVPVPEVAQLDPAPDEDSLVSDPEPLRGKHVLVVDDRYELRTLLQMLLEDIGARVSTASDGEEALERLGADGGDFDGVLMDMQMPVMDGYTATRALRERGIELPVIAVTAHALREEMEACLEAGCTAYTSKPIEEDELLRLLVRYVARRTG